MRRNYATVRAVVADKINRHNFRPIITATILFFFLKMFILTNFLTSIKKGNNKTVYTVPCNNKQYTS